MFEFKRFLHVFFYSSLLLGCEKQYLANDGYSPEISKIEASENKNAKFFVCEKGFSLSADVVDQINKLLKDTRNNGIDNIGFMLISGSATPADQQEKLKKKIYSLMHSNGFINSRIIDSGLCVYKGAKDGVRIDILTYDAKAPDSSKWSEYIGDIDTNKNLPKYGASEKYNLIEMIANKADLIAPRKYKGQTAKASIEAMASTDSGAGSSSSSSSSSSSGSTTDSSSIGSSSTK